jgi:flavocytochrome c
MDASDHIQWSSEFDVVVIGAGFAGLAAAIEAVEAGASVAVLEKMKGYGGNSIISDGGVSAAGTPEQAEAGIFDSPKRMAEDMMRAGLGLNHPELVRVLTQHSYDALLWTREHLGVEYLDRLDQFGGHSVRRCYTARGRSGAAIILKQIAKLKEHGVVVHTRTLLDSFIVDGSGRVVGVNTRSGFEYPRRESGAVRAIRARRGVVLATGGFGADTGFRRVQDPRLDEKIDTTNKACTTAESLQAAMRIGAMPVQLSWIQLGPWASPDEKMYGSGPDFASYIAFPYGMMVDPATGSRFVNELADRKVRADAILETGAPAVAITDSQAMESSGYNVDRALKKGVVKTFDSLQETARHYGIPFEPFEQAVQKYNGSVTSGIDEAFGKTILPAARPLTRPPFFTMRVWPKIHHTMGGVRINTDAMVIDLDGNPIKGLYAAGEITGGVHGACRLGSCAITDCLVFGRIAGKNAAGKGGAGA